MAITIGKINFKNIPTNGDGKLYMKCINMGQGDCTYIITPKGKRIMIDVGSNRWGTGREPDIKNELGPVKSLDLMILTHPDADHYNKIGMFVGRAVIKQLYYSNYLQSYKSNAFRIWKRDAIIGKEKLLQVNKDHPDRVVLLQDTSGFKLTALAANVGNPTTSSDALAINTGSIVVRGVFGKDSFLVAADATCATEDFMLKGGGLASSIMRIGHHGSTTSSSVDFINATSPRIGVISSSRDNGRYDLPRQSVVDRWNNKISGTTQKHTIGYWEDDADPCSKIVEDAQVMFPYGEEFGGNHQYGTKSTTKELYETFQVGTVGFTITGV